jgi:CHAT domain-containing protein/tetratricopeptide (TPR) repeat protein
MIWSPVRYVGTWYRFALVAGLCCALTPALAAGPPTKAAPPAAAPAAKGARPTEADPLELLRRASELFLAGKYSEAIPVSKQLIATFESMGMGDQPIQAQNYAMLGDLYRFSGDYAAAETAHRKALAMRVKAFGNEHADVAASLVNLHHLYAAQGRYDEAETLLGDALAMRERLLKPDDPELAMTRVSLAKLYAARGRHDRAEPILREALALFQAKLGPTAPYTGVAINNLAQALMTLGRYGEAEPLFKTALDINEKVAGPASPLAATALSNLSELYRAQGRFPEAEALRRREIAIMEAAVGPDSPDLAISLNNFGTLLSAEARAEEAEVILRRALAIQEKYYKADHPDIAVTLNNIADAVSKRPDRIDEAIALYRRSLALREKTNGERSQAAAVALNNLAATLIEAKRYAEAEPIARRSIAIDEATRPPGHPAIATGLNNLANVLDYLGRFDEARPVYERSLAIRKAALGNAHPDVIVSLLNIGSNAIDRRDWRAAFDTLNTAGGLWRQRQSVLNTGLSAFGTRAGSDMERTRSTFLGLALAAERLRMTAGEDEKQRLTSLAFEALQLSSDSAAAGALAKAGARSASGNPLVAALVRDRQDIAERYQTLDRQMLLALGETGAALDQKLIDQSRAAMATLTSRAAALDATLVREFPDYASLLTPAPLPLSDTQALLGEHEALVLAAPTRSGTHVFAVTRDQVRWYVAKLTGNEATAQVAALRCGLDAESWVPDGGKACRERTQASPEGDLLPFDTGLAHRLFKDLLGPAEDVIQGKRLLILGSDAFTTLPFHVLVTAPPPAGATIRDRLAGVAWLGQSYPTTLIASVAGLKIERGKLRDAQAAKPFLAFANPLLTGADGRDRSAFERQACPPRGPQTLARVASRSMTRADGGKRMFDIEEIRRAVPLPETADEVCAVADALSASQSDIYLGARATVRQVKLLAQQGALANFRIIHFATHGLVAGGQSSIEAALTEPSILLTPPPPGTTGAALDEDSGLLRASDIAALQLNAEWVVLSACNTAAGGAKDAEQLSGLARAFFHAGAKALLVSHWAIDSDAAVVLTTRAFSELARDPGLVRASALQRAMATLIASPDARLAHPASWAPFVVVGHGL